MKQRTLIQKGCCHRKIHLWFGYVVFFFFYSPICKIHPKRKRIKNSKNCMNDLVSFDAWMCVYIRFSTTLNWLIRNLSMLLSKKKHKIFTITLLFSYLKISDSIQCIKCFILNVKCVIRFSKCNNQMKIIKIKVNGERRRGIRRRCRCCCCFPISSQFRENICFAVFFFFILRSCKYYLWQLDRVYCFLIFIYDCFFFLCWFVAWMNLSIDLFCDF